MDDPVVRRPGHWSLDGRSATNSAISTAQANVTTRAVPSQRNEERDEDEAPDQWWRAEKGKA